MMITFEKLNKLNEASVHLVQLSELHENFASSPQAFLSDSAPMIHKFIVKNNDEVIGFFKLDFGYSNHFDFCSSNDLGFKTLALDSRVHGKGLGTKCMEQLPEYIASNYPQYEYIYLTVNCKNLGARACYIKAGFEDTGQLYLNGPVGPQHIMRRKIA
ncbi:GNAT family N-acetyltransferase [Vibrio rotiferianus]|uniref:GNAT family N-acetyltransferase n=1 Tax=Vibrio rotiferianus TaxID=190895 RepID=UPI0021754168|nr:GNAT family N-acetyltransferase [Vibrio rotiferianus]